MIPHDFSCIIREKSYSLFRSYSFLYANYRQHSGGDDQNLAFSNFTRMILSAWLVAVAIALSMQLAI